MTHKKHLLFLLASVAVAGSVLMTGCDMRTPSKNTAEPDERRVTHNISCIVDNVTIRKSLKYNEHTLGDSYTYKDTPREFQWAHINDSITMLVNYECGEVVWGTLQNYKNQNDVPPLAHDHTTDKYNSRTDRYGVQRTQAAPLYLPSDLETPERYGRDGELVRFSRDSADYVVIAQMHEDTEYYVPKAYFKKLKITAIEKVIAVDVTNQNIATLEWDNDDWLVRSMNPATTGLDNPPFQYATPLGVYVVQEKKAKMYYTRDGTDEITGYAPYASRFTRGAYIHGVPLNDPDARNFIEFSPTLGTTPRSHMCVRTATSHAKFIYDWAEPLETVVIVID